MLPCSGRVQQTLWALAHFLRVLEIFTFHYLLSVDGVNLKKNHYDIMSVIHPYFTSFVSPYWKGRSLLPFAHCNTID